MEYLENGAPGFEIFGMRVNYPGETVCGDDWLVTQWRDRTLIGLIDGLGHGEKARQSAVIATETIREMASKEQALDLADIMQACHQNLRRKRGAAIALVALGTERAEFLSVGNVQIEQSVKAPIGVLCRPGIVGRKQIRYDPMAFDVVADNCYFLFTDGLRGHFELKNLSDLKHSAKSLFN